MKNKLFWLITLAILAKLVFFIIHNQKYFLRPFDPDFIGKLYSESQYVIGQRSVGGIGDDGLYAFAGYYYLYQGGDVSAVNFEHPPLGKYLIGLSILFFGNENIINIVYFLVILLITFKLGQIQFRNQLTSLLAVVLVSVDNLFLDNLIRSLLDLPFTVFFVTAVYFFIKSSDKPKYIYLSNFFWGLAFSTRFFPILIIIIPYLLITILFYNRKLIWRFILSTLLIPGIYILNHISYFIYHPSLFEFLRHKKWMLSWFTGSVNIFGNIFRNIFTGKYIDSTGSLVVNEHWMPILPVVTLLAILSFRKSYFLKKNRSITVIYGLCILYLIYLTVLTGGVQKFLMPIYPLLCVLAAGNIADLYSIIGTCWNRKQVKLKGK